MIEEYRNELSNNLTVNVQANEINEIREKSIEKNSVRIFKEGKIYSSNFLGKTTQNKLKNDALENTFAALNFDYEYQPQLNISKSSGVKQQDKDVISLTSQLVEHFTEKLPDFIYSGKISFDSSEEVITAPQSKVENSKSHSSGFLILKRKGSPNIMDSFIAFNSAKGIIQLDDFSKCIALHQKFDNIVEIENGKYPVIMVEPNSCIAKFLESCSPDQYHQGSAYYAGKLGQKIFNQNLTFRDVRVDEDLGINNYFSDEFESLEPTLPLIEKGVFKNIFYDRKTAHKYKAQSSGNGRRNYNSSIAPASYNLSFAPGESSYNELTKKFKKVLVVIIAGGGDTTSNGDYSSPVQLGFLIENGEIKGRLPEVSITNNIDRILGEDFIAVPSDKFFPTQEYPLMCYMNLVK